MKCHNLENLEKSIDSLINEVREEYVNRTNSIEKYALEVQLKKLKQIEKV